MSDIIIELETALDDAYQQMDEPEDDLQREYYRGEYQGLLKACKLMGIDWYCNDGKHIISITYEFTRAAAQHIL